LGQDVDPYLINGIRNQNLRHDPAGWGRPEVKCREGPSKALEARAQPRPEAWRIVGPCR
jgi:hypothetical protein